MENTEQTPTFNEFVIQQLIISRIELMNIKASLEALSAHLISNEQINSYDSAYRASFATQVQSFAKSLPEMPESFQQYMDEFVKRHVPDNNTSS
jgi:Sec7-like guanine-nucleotide exchange factor